MVSRSKIESYASEIAQRFQPRRIILFGSYAGGTPTEDSDVDLLVIMRECADPVETAAAIRSAIPRSFPVDLMVRDLATVQWRAANNDYFLKEVLANGVVLYEAANARVA